MRAFFTVDVCMSSRNSPGASWCKAGPTRMSPRPPWPNVCRQENHPSTSCKRLRLQPSQLHTDRGRKPRREQGQPSPRESYAKYASPTPHGSPGFWQAILPQNMLKSSASPVIGSVSRICTHVSCVPLDSLSIVRNENEESPAPPHPPPHV